MASASEGLHPKPFHSLADDFVVISDGSSASPPNTPSPDEHQSKYCLSLLDHTSSESDIQKLAKQIDGVRMRNSSLQSRLTGNSTSIDQIHGALLTRLKEMQKTSQEAETALMLKTEQYLKLQSDNDKLREDCTNLTQKQEEWAQTYKDYSKLKNDYNLLTNTKERLESERADLQRNRDEALTAETAKVKAAFDEKLKSEIEAEQARCRGELTAAQKKHDDELQAAKQDWDNCKLDLLSRHKEAMAALQSQLEQQIQKLQADLEFAKSDSQSALDSEREKRRADLDELVSGHRTAMANMAADYEAKISEQIALVEAARQELSDSASKYEEEKKELFDQLRQLNLGGSFQHVAVPSSTDAETNVPSMSSVCHTNLGSFLHVPSANNRDAETNTVLSSVVFSDTDYLNAMDRRPVQEQASSTDSQQMADAATHVSLANSVAVHESEPTAAAASVELANASMGDRAAVLRTAVSECPETQRIQLATKEVQTDEVQQEFQVANADSLQRESVLRNLHMQLASFAQSLRTERDLKGKLELEQRQLQKECDDLRLQLRAAQSITGSDQNRATTLQQTVGDLRTQLQKKQSELDSVLEDLDETRHKLYEHMESEKRQQCLLTANEVQIEKLKQNIRELESHAEIEKSQLQMELDSIHKSDQFKDTKLTAAQNEAENLKQELQRLRQSEDELNKRCRENDQTVQQIMESADQEKQRFNEEIEKLKDKSAAQLEALESNKQTLEQKAGIEMRLREEITSLADRLERKAAEIDTFMLEANRKWDALYNKMCDYSDQLANAKKHAQQVNDQLNRTELQLRQTTDRLAKTEEQLRQSTTRLEDSQKFVSEMQSYSSGLEAKIESMTRQMQESTKKRDDVINVAEQLRNGLETQLRQCAQLEADLSKLKDEHTTVRADCSNMEQNMTQMLAKERELQGQLAQAQNRLQQAEQAIEYHKRQAQGEAEKFNAEREQLNVRINSLIDELTSANAPASNSSDNFLTRHRNSVRSPHGGGNV